MLASGIETPEEQYRRLVILSTMTNQEVAELIEKECLISEDQYSAFRAILETAVKRLELPPKEFTRLQVIERQFVWFLVGAVLMLTSTILFSF